MVKWIGTRWSSRGGSQSWNRKRSLHAEHNRAVRKGCWKSLLPTAAPIRACCQAARTSGSGHLISFARIPQGNQGKRWISWVSKKNLIKHVGKSKIYLLKWVWQVPFLLDIYVYTENQSSCKFNQAQLWSLGGWHLQILPQQVSRKLARTCILFTVQHGLCHFWKLPYNASRNELGHKSIMNKDIKHTHTCRILMLQFFGRPKQKSQALCLKLLIACNARGERDTAKGAQSADAWSAELRTKAYTVKYKANQSNTSWKSHQSNCHINQNGFLLCCLANILQQCQQQRKGLGGCKEGAPVNLLCDSKWSSWSWFEVSSCLKSLACSKCVRHFAQRPVPPEETNPLKPVRLVVEGQAKVGRTNFFWKSFKSSRNQTMALCSAMCCLHVWSF